MGTLAKVVKIGWYFCQIPLAHNPEGTAELRAVSLSSRPQQRQCEGKTTLTSRVLDKSELQMNPAWIPNHQTFLVWTTSHLSKYLEFGLLWARSTHCAEKATAASLSQQWRQLAQQVLRHFPLHTRQLLQEPAGEERHKIPQSVTKFVHSNILIMQFNGPAAGIRGQAATHHTWYQSTECNLSPTECAGVRRGETSTAIGVPVGNSMATRSGSSHLQWSRCTSTDLKRLLGSGVGRGKWLCIFTLVSSYTERSEKEGGKNLNYTSSR